MVTFVTGKMNSGKTTKLYELYQETLEGDGFLAIKHMIDSTVAEYDAKRLSADEMFPYVVRDVYDDGSKPILCQIGPYRLYEDAVRKMEKELRRLIDYSIQPIYLDEIGVLELEGKCFATVLQEMVDSKLDLVLTVRRDLLERVVERFHIKEYTIVETD